MQSLRPALLGAALAMPAATAPVQAANLLGNSFGGGTTVATLYDVDTATGAASNPRTMGIGSVIGIRLGPDGFLYGLTTYAGVLGQPNSLYRFDPATGAPTLVGATGLSDTFEGDLDFHPTTGLLYGVQDVPDVFGGPCRIFRINTATGAASNVVPLSGTTPQDLSAMAFAPNGTLHVIDSGTTSSRLLTMNPDTGSVLTSIPLSLSLGWVAGMAFDSGVCYVADGSSNGTNRLYSLNTTTGQLTLIGNLNVSTGLAGLTAIPEPGSLMLIGTIAMLLRATERGDQRGRPK